MTFSHPKIVPFAQILRIECPFYLVDSAFFESCLILFRLRDYLISKVLPVSLFVVEMNGFYVLLHYFLVAESFFLIFFKNSSEEVFYLIFSGYSLSPDSFKSSFLDLRVRVVQIRIPYRFFSANCMLVC